MRHSVYCLLILTSLGARAAFAQPLVAETPPLSPGEQLAKFHLPPGFEIQLVAEEPHVHKPMNMKFDVHGRLWVTHSLEYPFPAADDTKARDAITIFSDFSATGKAQKAQRFAEHLNIPIGVLPLSDKEALAWSIPNIYRLTDTDGNGVADQKTNVFGPFGVVDTHGNQNSFTRWIDGWIYANHGFNNDSHIKMGSTGDEVLHMQSGNTYRFRADNSAIEQFSWGQVNPFGLTFDPLGNLFSADCHSSAVTMLLREGYYQSFGKPHDGLGFAPEITHTDHGGTGIAGVVYSTLPNFPSEYRDVLFIGNVITNRVHCDRLKWTGSTPVVEKVEDFLTCDDPWFRPVDLQQGPDGALYVADFYNCIIGHYEVPLTHPKRDRERGRIWRIVYKGESSKSIEQPLAGPMPDLQTLNAQALFSLLRHPNLTVRVLATNYLLDRFPKEAAAMSSELLTRDLRAELESNRSNSSLAEQQSHAVWILQRTSGISESLAHNLLGRRAPVIVQVHTVKALGETADWQRWHFDLVRSALSGDDPFVRRAAAESLAKHPTAENISPLLTLLSATAPEDAQLLHGTRIALRDQLRSLAVADQLLALKLPPEHKKQLVEFAASAPSGPAALLVFDEALKGNVSDDLLVKAIPAAARYVDTSRVDAMIENLQERFPDDSTQQIALLSGLAEGLSQRGLPATDLLRSRLTALIKSALAGHPNAEWSNTPLSGDQATESPWGPQQRKHGDGANPVLMISSLPAGGERLGGILRSPLFKLPTKLSFWMAGHNGSLPEPDRQLNFTRLILEDGTEVARSYPPRNDVAQHFEWDLSTHVGKRGRVEVVDGTTDLDGYAWLAVSRFEPALIRVPNHPVAESGAVLAELYRLAGQLKLSGLTTEIAEAVEPTNANLVTRLAATDALVMLEPERAIAPLTAVLADANVATSVREQATQQLGRIDRDRARAALLVQLKAAPESVAVLIAAALAGNQESASTLLKEIREGRASAALLREPTVVDRLKACGLAGVDNQISELTADLSPADNRIGKLIAQRRASFLADKYDVELGRAVFAKSVCANCHRIGEVGKTIGPALDGIGNRGLDRLLEDTLDPNRNVDIAFRTESIETVDGQILSGFGLREEGQTLVFNDPKGEQVRVPLAEVVEHTQSTLSPMPANLIEQMPERDYYALLAYLLSLKGK